MTFLPKKDKANPMIPERSLHRSRRDEPRPSLVRVLGGLSLGLALSACSPSAPRTASLPPIEWRLVPEATVLGERRQFFLYGRGLDRARVSGPAGVESETGEVLNEGRALSLYLKVHPMGEDSAAGKKETKRGKPGTREIRVSTLDTSVTFTLKIVDEAIPR